MAGRKPGVTGYQLVRLKMRAWMYSQQSFSARAIARLMGRAEKTVYGWLAEIKELANDESLLGMIRESLVAYSTLCWAWTNRADILLETLEERPWDMVLRARYDLALSYARHWEQKWETAVMIGWRAVATAVAQRDLGGGDFTQFIYPTVDEFYAEIREYRRRAPLLAAPAGLLEPPKEQTIEEEQAELDEFQRTHGTEILPTETL